MAKKIYFGDATIRLRNAGFEVVPGTASRIYAHKGDVHHEFAANFSGLYDADEIDAAIAAAKA